MAMAGAAVTELEVCGLCLAIHDDPQSVAWDHLWSKGFGFVGHKRIRDTDVVIWRGSYDPWDWYRDLSAVTVVSPAIGRVHDGFLSGVESRYDEVEAALGRRVVIGGHSLGAAEAADHAGLRIAAGKPVEHVYLYGCPRPGMQKLADVLAPVPITSRKNLSDPVTRVPWDIPLFDPYVHVRPQIPMAVQPPASDTDFFREHHCELYFAGVKALASQSPGK